MTGRLQHSFMLSVALSLVSSSAIAADAHDAARESVRSFYAAIRDGDANAFADAVYKQEMASKVSMEYQAYETAIGIRSRVKDILRELAANGADLDFNEVLRSMAVYYHILDPEFFGAIESARVFVDESGTAALSELSYDDNWWFLEVRLAGGHWQVVLNERYDEEHKAAAFLVFVNIASMHVSEAEDAVERREFDRAVKELRSLNKAQGETVQD